MQHALRHCHMYPVSPLFKFDKIPRIVNKPHAHTTEQKAEAAITANAPKLAPVARESPRDLSPPVLVPVEVPALMRSDTDVAAEAGPAGCVVAGRCVGVGVEP